MKKKVNFMMWQYKAKKFFRDKREFIVGIGYVMFAIIGISVLIIAFSFIEDAETVKIVSAATSILVIIDLYDTIQQSR